MFGMSRHGCYCVTSSFLSPPDATKKDRNPQTASFNWTIWNISENWNSGIA